MNKQTIFALLLLSAALASAAPASVNVTGYGRIQGPSDIASIAVSVSRTAPLASAARQNVSDAVGRLLTALSKVNGGAVSVTTTSLSISPATTYNSKTQTNTRIGYEMSQSVQVAIKNVSSPLLASVVDAIVGTGDVTISSINFGLAAATKQRMSAECRTKAAEDATGTAKLYAQALGMELGAVTNLQELSVTSSSVGSYSSDVNDGPVETSVARAASIGQQSVTVSVTATFSLKAPAMAAPATAAGGK